MTEYGRSVEATLTMIESGAVPTLGSCLATGVRATDTGRGVKVSAIADPVRCGYDTQPAGKRAYLNRRILAHHGHRDILALFRSDGCRFLSEALHHFKPLPRIPRCSGPN